LEPIVSTLDEICSIPNGEALESRASRETEASMRVRAAAARRARNPRPKRIPLRADLAK
jgi:hypothetical protein